MPMQSTSCWSPGAVKPTCGGPTTILAREQRVASSTPLSSTSGRRKATVFGSARLPLDHPACKAAVEMGRRLAEAGFMIITGAANGIMEAGHIGAGREASIGVNILLPFEQEANSIIAATPSSCT